MSILDLGASQVKAMVIERTDAEVAVLGRACQTHQAKITTGGIDGDLDGLTAICDEALTRAEDATESVVGTKIVPDSVLMAVPTGWLRGAVGIGRVQRPNLEDGIVETECLEPALRAARHAMRLLGKETGQGEWELLDASVVAFSVDGHGVTDPVGFRGYALEAWTFVAAAPRRMVRLLRDVADHLQLNPPLLVAEPMALAAAVPDDGLVIQVGGRTTGLVAVRHRAPSLFCGLDMGGRAFLEALGEAFGLSLGRADTLLRAYSGGRLQEKAAQSVAQVLTGPLDRWAHAVAERLEPWHHRDVEWSPQIMLCGGLAGLNELARMVSRMRWMEMLPFPYSPQVRTWGGSNLSQVVDHTSPRWQLMDVTGLACAAWVLRDRGPGTTEGIVRSALGIRSGL